MSLLLKQIDIVGILSSFSVDGGFFLTSLLPVFRAMSPVTSTPGEINRTASKLLAKKKFHRCSSYMQCLMNILVKLYLNTRQQQFHGCLILQFILSNCLRYHYVFCIEHSILIFYSDFVCLDLKEYLRFFFILCVCQGYLIQICCHWLFKIVLTCYSIQAAVSKEPCKSFAFCRAKEC